MIRLSRRIYISLAYLIYRIVHHCFGLTVEVKQGSWQMAHIKASIKGKLEEEALRKIDEQSGQNLSPTSAQQEEQNL